jgi:hypothetical protein
MTPQRRIGSALVLSCLLAGPSLAEIININVSGEVVGSGFSNMNSQLGYGIYQLSGSGSDGLSEGSAQQTVNSMTSGFSIDLQGDASYGGFPGTFGFSGVYNTLTLSFRLTQLSVLNLTGSLNSTCSFGPFEGCLFSAGTESIDLSGSDGFDFNQQVDLLTEGGGNEPLNFSTTLNPGDYILTALSSPSVESQVMSSTSSEVSLNADFTAAIPEPSGAVIIPVLFVAVWLCISVKRRWHFG